ncbi:MAG: hypothetical protein V4621_07330 [Pseudomonadota bacterium]
MHDLSCLKLLLLGSFVATACAAVSPAHAAGKSDSLIITNAPLPAELRKRVYESPLRPIDIDPAQITGPNYYDSQSTSVRQEIAQITTSLGRLQSRMADLSGQSLRIKQENQKLAAEYYTNIATINTQLQTGTTPGNPRLVVRLNNAQRAIDSISANASALNGVSSGLASLSAEANALINNARAAYGITGAVEEDHLQLAQIEDSVSSNVVTLTRLQNDVGEDMMRTNAYLAAEMNNMRTVSMAVTAGEFYGTQTVPSRAALPAPVATNPVATVSSVSAVPMMIEPEAAMRMPPVQDTYVYDQPKVISRVETPAQTAPVSLAPTMPSGQTLAKVDVQTAGDNYAGPVYDAMNEAIVKYPNARFEVIGVSPQSDNAAKSTLDSSKARRNAEKLSRVVTEMGIPADRLMVSSAARGDVTGNEIHVILR